MKLTFLGAAGEVTGSQHLVETDTHRFLLDCGLFQGRRSETYSKNATFHCSPKNLDGVFLSHAHIDHCGNLPGLYRAGFRGPIYCTAATADVAAVMLRDSARIQQEDAHYIASRHDRAATPIEPLYSEKDARQVARQFEPLEEGVWHELSKDLSVRFQDAGHILGSSVIELDLKDDRDRKRLVFSGDLGRRGMPILRDPTLVDGCDVLICESTYGNRVHPPFPSLKVELLKLLKHAEQQQGRVIIPAFSLGRTQQLIYLLNGLFHEGELPRMPVYVDSPLATRLTDLHREHPEHFNDAIKKTLTGEGDIFWFDFLTYIRDHRESMELNDQEGPFIVISASGMCENGRIRHHLKHAISDPRNTVCLIGYQAPNTLGRRIEQRQPFVNILGRRLALECQVEKLDGLSAHADVEDLRWWIREMSMRGGIGECFLVHGEAEVARQLAEVIRDDCNEDPIVPGFGDSFEV